MRIDTEYIMIMGYLGLWEWHRDSIMAVLMVVVVGLIMGRLFDRQPAVFGVVAWYGNTSQGRFANSE